MQTVGFMYEAQPGKNPYHTMGLSRFYRVIEMSKLLAKDNIRLLVYSPICVDQVSQKVTGYYYSDKSFVETRAPIPKVNGNWYFGDWLMQANPERPAVTFKQWSDDKAINIYLPWDFLALIDDKSRTHALVSEVEPTFMPRVENYDYTQTQLESFFEQANSVFLKPHASAKGRRIMVVRKIKHGYKFTYYNLDETHSVCKSSLDALFPEMARYLDKRHVIIQQGIDTIKYHGSSFDIRVIMLNDGDTWQAMHHIRLGPRGSDLSYNPNEYGSVDTLPVLIELFGETKAQAILKRVVARSTRLATHFATYAPDRVMEIAYDILLDEAGESYIAETNSQPGLWYEKPFSNIFNLPAAEQIDYDRQIVPHGQALARFFKKRLG